MKNCNNEKCSQVNPQSYSQFYKEKTSSDGYKHRCKSCTRQVDSKFYKNNKELLKTRVAKWKESNPEKVKDSQLKTSYGISLEDYKTQLLSQNNCCAICQTNKPNGRSNKYFYVDHSHKTGKVRGLLCYSCNLALGILSENPSVVQRLIEYIKKYEK